MWRALPAFALEPGGALRFVTKRRGGADPAPDRLELGLRSWWLDFDGRGYHFGSGSAEPWSAATGFRWRPAPSSAGSR